ncbi:hypothetical protein Vafri_5027 [Volvox africanus]|uniref:Uncharacterized protein n=1 Tax=Volvox africanus TaxID=51714 RepID=A0A8J4AZ71_9CHLO|nr:hypothetical protein Vafri_5027 [Volvox africanus]
MALKPQAPNSLTRWSSPKCCTNPPNVLIFTYAIAQYGPYVYHEVLPSAGDQAEPAIAQKVHASISSYGNRAAGSRAAIGSSHLPAQPSDGAAAGAVAAYHQAAAAVAAAAAAAAAAGLPYPPPTDVTFILSQRGNSGRQSVPASRAAQAPGHVVMSVYPASPPPSQQMSPPPPPPPPRQEQRQLTDAAAATAEDGDVEAPDSPLKGVVIRSAVASPSSTTAAAAASAAGTLAAAEAWLAAVADQVGSPDVPVAGPAAAAESFRDITLLPRRQISAAETDAGGTPPMDADAAELPPTPTAIAGAAVPSLAGTAETQLRVGASVDSLQPMRLRVPSPHQHLSDSIQGPLPGGSSPKPRDGGSQLAINMGPGANPSGVLSSSATEILRAQSPAVYGSVVRRPATAAAAMPATSPVPTMNRPRSRLVRDAGRAPSQAYGYNVGAESVVNAPPPPPAGEGQAEVLTIHPPHWESMSRLEADPSYVHYPTITAKGEFGGSVPHPRSEGTFFPPAPQAGPSWRSYLMRSRLSAPGSRGSADWSRSSSAMAAAARASASRAPAASFPYPADPVGLVDARHHTGTGGARHEAGYRQTGPSISKRGLWESRAALAAEARGMRAAARLLRAENRRLAGEVAALDDSVEGLEQGVLSPEFVRLHAESVERRLEFAEQYDPLVAGTPRFRSELVTRLAQYGNGRG